MRSARSPTRFCNGELGQGSLCAEQEGLVDESDTKRQQLVESETMIMFSCGQAFASGESRLEIWIG